ncbi:hypothetical protein HC928_04150 [bacterium]|nr:hypothetical protein [bacterium]
MSTRADEFRKKLLEKKGQMSPLNSQEVQVESELGSELDSEAEKEKIETVQDSSDDSSSLIKAESGTIESSEEQAQSVYTTNFGVKYDSKRINSALNSAAIEEISRLSTVIAEKINPSAIAEGAVRKAVAEATAKILPSDILEVLEGNFFIQP